VLGEECSGVKVAIIDVGSNSVRLLVAAVEAGRAEQLHRDRVYVRLGDDAYRLGRISARKLDETRDVARRFAQIARKRGAERVETIVTAPGRQSSNRAHFVDVLVRATQAPVVVLGADDEGRLAWEGAVSRMDGPPEVVAVVDLGGGSCELAVGTPLLGPSWVRSRDAGSLRVTRALLGDVTSPPDLKAVRREISALLGDLAPPQPDAALAVGGTARAVGRLVGKRFGPDELTKLAKAIARKGAQTVVKGSGITTERAQTLLGGTLVLAEVAERLGTGLEVGRGGLREGAALALARTEAAVA
jgi:exopolyphosphatase/guanosine-5'-triphosphate,3'-diphosphate pyrophosphatase